MLFLHRWSIETCTPLKIRYQQVQTKAKVRNTGTRSPFLYIKLTAAPPKAHHRCVLRTRLGYHEEFLRREQGPAVLLLIEEDNKVSRRSKKFVDEHNLAQRILLPTVRRNVVNGSLLVSTLRAPEPQCSPPK